MSIDIRFENKVHRVRTHSSCNIGITTDSVQLMYRLMIVINAILLMVAATSSSILADAYLVTNKLVFR